MGLKDLSCVPLSFCLYLFKQRLRKPPWQKHVSSREHFSKDCCAVCNVILSPGPHTLFLKTRLITSVVKSYWTRKQTTLWLVVTNYRWYCVGNNCSGTSMFLWPSIKKWAVSLWPFIRKDYQQSRHFYLLSFLSQTNMKPFLKYQLFNKSLQRMTLRHEKHCSKLDPEVCALSWSYSREGYCLGMVWGKDGRGQCCSECSCLEQEPIS